MGRDKAFLRINGEALIAKQVRLLRGVFKNIIIVTNSPQKYAGFKSINPVREQTAFSNGVKIVRDVISGRGPLIGIYSGLLASESFYNFVVACDMPFINAKLIEYMVTLKDGFDIVVPRVEGRHHALFAIYSKNCVKPISEAIEKNRLRVKGLFADVKVRELDCDEIAGFGEADDLFMNVNTKEDLSRIRAC